jgi:hypothetical protein
MGIVIASCLCTFGSIWIIYTVSGAIDDYIKRRRYEDN